MRKNISHTAYKQSTTDSSVFSLMVMQASLNQTAMDFPRNMENICDAIDKAVAQGADRLDLAELTLTAYGCNDDFQRTDNKIIYEYLQDIAAYAKIKDPNLIITIGHPWRLARRNLPALPGLEAESAKNPLFNRLDLPYNVQSTIANGKVAAMTAKMYLFKDERGYESRYFQEWSMQAANEAGGVHGTIDIRLPDGRKIPFGRPVIHWHDAKRNLRMNEAKVICEERWVGSRYGGAPYTDRYYKRYGVVPSIARYIGSTKGLLIVIPNASPPAGLKIDKHMHLVSLASRFADAVVDTDDVGNQDSTYAQFGHRLAAQRGKIISAGYRASFERVATTTMTIRLHSAPEETAAKAHLVLRHEFKNAVKPPHAELAWRKQEGRQEWDDPANPNRYAEEVLRMTALWLFDYMRKTGTQGIAEALSGGADSAFNCVMVEAMVRLAVEELGVEGFLREMSHLKYADDVNKSTKGGSEAVAITVRFTIEKLGVERFLEGASESVYAGDIRKAYAEGGTEAVVNMVRHAIDELGVDGFLEKLPQLHETHKIKTAFAGGNEAAIQTCMDNMLTAVYMGTNNNPPEHYNAAKYLMEGDGAASHGIGGKFMNRNVQDLLDFNALVYAVEDTSKIPGPRKMELMEAVAAYLNQRPGSVTQEELDRQAADLRARFPEITGDLISAADPRTAVGYENIQARAREVIIMAIANAEGKMAIANPNLDEARNAYATFGGDLHSGTVNLNGHLPKAFQLMLMHYLHKNGLHGAMGPVESLGPVLKNKPSAGLQPLDKDGKLIQTDEGSLQRSFVQMDKISRLMLYERVKTRDGLRRLNAGEIYGACRKDKMFESVDDNMLFNMIEVSYRQWAIAQHKIHASPIAPTFGLNVDHQTSLRTPNLSGWSKDELAVLGVGLMEKWAAGENIAIPGLQTDLAYKRARQDDKFVKIFAGELWNRAPKGDGPRMDFNLKQLYGKVKEKGWESTFPPLQDGHYIMAVRQYRSGQAALRPS